jgi:hypothetical protein
MRQSNKLIIVVIILFSIAVKVFSQNDRHQHKKAKKIETKLDSSQQRPQLNASDTFGIQKIKKDTTNTQNLKIDTVKEKILDAENEIRKNLRLLLALNSSSLDSIKNIVSKKDSAFNLRLDTIVKQTEPEGFWKGFIKDSLYTWLYDTIKKLFSSEKDTSGSLLLRIFTFLGLVARCTLLKYRLKEYFGNEKEINKPNKFRLLISVLSWLILVYSFFSYLHNKHEENLSNIIYNIKQIEKTLNQQINATAHKDYQFYALLKAINKNSNAPEQQLAGYQEIESQLKIQGEIFAKSQKDVENQILELKKRQTDTEKNIINKVKDYSIGGFWIFFLILVIIFARDIRNVIEKNL